MKKLAEAIKIASEAFVNKFDKGGKPYILHCLFVMDKVKHLGEIAMICAVLHDLIEDCEKDGYDFDFLYKQQFPMEVIGILGLLTHKKDVPYMDYIKQIATNKIATEIKKADLEHNSNITRLKGLTKKDFDRLEKYSIAYTYLKNI